MQKKIKAAGVFLGVFLVLFGLLLWINVNSQHEIEKVSFTYQTGSIADFTTDLTLKKPGTVVAAQDIQVAAQANGRVSKILVKEGMQVKGGQPIIQLADTVADYALQVQRAKNNLDRALLTKQQTQATLAQQIQQAENAYKNAEQAFELAQTTSTNAIKQADISLYTASTQIDTLKAQFQPQKLALESLLTAVSERADKLLGVTDYFEDQHTGFEIYIGARNEHHKEATKQSLRSLYQTKAEISQLSTSFASDWELKTAVEKLNTGYLQIESFAEEMIEMLRNSIPADGSFPQTKIDEHIAYFQGIKNSQGRTAFISYHSQVNAQLMGSGTVAQDSAQISYENTLANAKNSLFATEIALRNAKVAYETLLETKESQIWLLDAAITEAKIAYESSLTQYSKLTLRAPISGVIGEILITEGQDVANGTLAFKISGNKKQHIEVALTATEYQYLDQKLPVQVRYQDKNLTGTIDAISTVADKTNLFKATILVDEDIDLLGDIATVSFPIQVQTGTTLPLQQVKILDQNRGTISILSGDQVLEYPIVIKSIWGDFIELAEPLSPNLQIMVSDLGAFDATRHMLNK